MLYNTAHYVHGGHMYYYITANTIIHLHAMQIHYIAIKCNHFTRLLRLRNELLYFQTSLSAHMNY